VAPLDDGDHYFVVGGHNMGRNAYIIVRIV